MKPTKEQLTYKGGTFALVGQDEQLTYATYATMAVTTLLTIVLLRSFTSMFWSFLPKFAALLGVMYALVAFLQPTYQSMLLASALASAIMYLYIRFLCFGTTNFQYNIACYDESTFKQSRSERYGADSRIPKIKSCCNMLASVRGDACFSSAEIFLILIGWTDAYSLGYDKNRQKKDQEDKYYKAVEKRAVKEKEEREKAETLARKLEWEKDRIESEKRKEESRRRNLGYNEKNPWSQEKEDEQAKKKKAEKEITDAHTPETKQVLRKWLVEYDQGLKNHDEPNTWYVSQISNMSHLFENLKNFNAPIDLWNTSQVKNMSHMFNGAESFNQPLNTWNVSRVEDMNSMFKGAESFNQPLDKWNVSSVQDMRCMFESATSFNQPLNMWKLSSMKSIYLKRQPIVDVFKQALAMACSKPPFINEQRERVAKKKAKDMVHATLKKEEEEKMAAKKKAKEEKMAAKKKAEEEKMNQWRREKEMKEYKKDMAEKENDAWEAVQDKDGDTYFWNSVTEESTWEQPPGFKSKQDQAKTTKQQDKPANKKVHQRAPGDRIVVEILSDEEGLKYCWGNIDTCNRDGTFAVTVDGLGKIDVTEHDLIRGEQNQAKTTKQPADKPANKKVRQRAPGDRIEISLQGNWFEGVIDKCNRNGTFAVTVDEFQDLDFKNVKEHEIRGGIGNSEHQIRLEKNMRGF